MTTHLTTYIAEVAAYADLVGDCDFTLADAGVPADVAAALRSSDYVCTTPNPPHYVLDFAELAAAAPAARHHPDSATITVQVDNPKRGGSAKRFAIYRDGLTVAEYIAGCQKLGYPRAKALADLRWDTAHEYITVDTPTAE